MGKVFKTLIRIGISIILISYLLYTQDFEKIKTGVLSYNPLFIIFALNLNSDYNFNRSSKRATQQVNVDMSNVMNQLQTL